MMGGMVGNNSCGSNSVIYRSTREHLMEVTAFLSDGSEVIFKALSLDDFHAKCELTTLEGTIYKSMRSMLSNYDNQVEIKKEFPKKSVERRNTGYAIDLLVEMAPFTAGGEDFNFCSLIAGSEGTLAFITEIKLNVVLAPPKETGLLCVHFNTIDELEEDIIILQRTITVRQERGLDNTNMYDALDKLNDLHAFNLNEISGPVESYKFSMNSWWIMNNKSIHSVTNISKIRIAVSAPINQSYLDFYETNKNICQ
jgi:FAD/FMN-containing dehydrogenase